MADPLAQTVFVEGAAEAGATTADSGPRVVGGRYEILGLLGAGGMGNVYRARDRELDEMVALKVLRPQIAGNPAALERFRREVKLARRVTHPNVARVFDIGDQGGEKYLTMELLDGEPLGALLERDKRLSAARAVQIVSAVCAGLDAAHAAGVVHRDLKPDNVLLTKDGRVVVTDFGIARAAASVDANITGAFVGTPAYMAPEQVDGSAVDTRADLYALGAMLFELVSGEPPWQGDNVLVIAAARLLRPPPDVRDKRPELAPELAAIITRCMARRPDERFATASEVARALAAVPIRGPAPSVHPRAPASAPPVFPSASPGKKQVAVLPFRNVGPEDHDHVADGLTEDLIDQLSMAKDLRVRSRGMVMRYRDGDRDPREVGRELDVPVVVQGSVRRDSGTVRVSVRLVSVTDGVQIWHRRFDRPEAELFAVSDTVARAISEALAVELPAAVRAAPDNAEAIDLYLRARARYVRYFDDLKGDSLQLFERALAAAPDDPRILAGFAMASGRLWTGRPEALEPARRAAERAVDLAPDLADSHVALAMVLYQERREPDAVRALARALRASPVNAEAHDMMGRILCETELQDAAKKHLETAISLEPDLQLSRAMLARLHMLRGAWDTADAIVETGRAEGSPRLPSATRMCLWSRNVERARMILEEERHRSEPTWALTRIILEMVAYGTPPYVRAPRRSDVTYRFATFLRQIEAECAMFLGDHERALTAMEESAAEGVYDVAWADGCPLFTPIRQDARFRAARDRIAARARLSSDAYLAATSGALQAPRT